MKNLFLILFISYSSHCFSQDELKERFNKGVELFKNQDFKGAGEIYSEILQNGPDDKVKKYCYIYRGLCYENLEDYKDALADFNKSIKLDPSDLSSYNDRALVYTYLKDDKKAIADYEHILKYDSTEREGRGALFGLARLYYSNKKYEMSLKYYDKLILVVTDPQFYFNRGCVKDMLMMPNESIKDYDRAIGLNPNYKEAYANRGVAKINILTSKGNLTPTKEQTSEACSDLQKAKELGDDSVNDLITVYCNKQ